MASCQPSWPQPSHGCRQASEPASRSRNSLPFRLASFQVLFPGIRLLPPSPAHVACWTIPDEARVSKGVNLSPFFSAPADYKPGLLSPTGGWGPVSGWGGGWLPSVAFAPARESSLLEQGQMSSARPLSFFFFFFLRSIPAAYGNFQARG